MILFTHSTFYSVGCDPVVMENIKLVYPIYKSGITNIPANIVGTDYIFLAAKDCDNSRKLQFNIFRGTKYGVALMHNPPNGVKIQVFDKGLYLNKPIDIPYPIYVIIKESQIKQGEVQ